MQKPQNNETMPLVGGFNFTPVHEGVRCRMKISAADERKVGPHRGLGFHGTVTDLEDGKQYDVYGADCEIPGCACDAVIRERV